MTQQHTQHRKTTLADYYARRFNSDPYALLDYCTGAIADEAASVGIDWSSIAGRVQLTGAKLNKGISTTEKKHRGKVAVWPEIKSTGRGLDFPQLTFWNSANGGQPAVWSGYKALHDLFQREHDLGGIDDLRHQRWLKRQEDKRAEREARHAAALEAEQRRQAREMAEANAYEAAYKTGEPQVFEYLRKNGTTATDTVEPLDTDPRNHPYLIAKDIVALVDVFPMRVMRDRFGDFVAVELHDIDGDYCGLQRLYADKKFYTVAGVAGRYNGAHCVIGDLATAGQRYIAEGFATAASIWLAEAAAGNDVAVIVAMNVDNLFPVAKAYREREPEVALINAVDNDRHKPNAGNAGMLAALRLARELEVRAVVPHFDGLELEAGSKPTDWNDYARLGGLHRTLAALHAKENRLSLAKDLLGYALQRLHYCGAHNVQAEALRAVGFGMLLVPSKYSTKEVVRMVLGSIPAGLPFQPFRIRARAVWIAKKKMEEAAQLRGFSKEALAQPEVQYHKVKAVIGEHGNPLIPEHLPELVKMLEGPIIVRAPMGSGKTEKLIKPIMAGSPKAGYIAHRISLIGDAAKRLEIDHYQNVIAAQLPYITGLACCVNSIAKRMFLDMKERSWFAKLDTLCIDEASQVIRHVAVGKVSNATRVFDTLIDAISSSRRTLLCDADANDLVIEACQLACPGQTIHVIEVEGQSTHIRVDHTGENEAWQLALEAAVAGRRVLVASDGAEKAKQLAIKIEELRPEVKVLLVHANSKSDQRVDRFLADPDGEAHKYDVLIYSPAISSGVSMKRPHFEMHFGLFSGLTIAPSDAVQMLRRDRNARHYILGLGINNGTRETDRDAIYRGIVAAEAELCELIETENSVALHRQKTLFDEISLSTSVNEAKSKNDFNNNLLLMLASDGYRIGRLAIDDPDCAAKGRSNREDAREVDWLRYMDRINSQQTPDEATATRLARQELKSEEEEAQLDRFNIETQLCVESIAEDDVEFYDHGQGLKHLQALELVQASEAQAIAYDVAQQQARVVLSRHRWKTTARRKLVAVFDALGIDPQTGEGFITSDACRAARDLLVPDTQSTELYNALKIGPYVKPGTKPKCATTFVKNLLKRMGLTVNKVKRAKNLYYINESRWARATRYLQLRAAKGVHSLTTFDASANVHHPRTADADTSHEPSADAARGDSQADDTLHSYINNNNQVSPLTLAERERFMLLLSSRPAAGVDAQKVREALIRDTGFVRAATGGDMPLAYLDAALTVTNALCAKSEGLPAEEMIDAVVHRSGIVAKLAAGQLDESFAIWSAQFAIERLGAPVDTVNTASI